MTRKYYKTKNAAIKACNERNEKECVFYYGVYKMPKGSRKAGWYAVCTYLEWLNTY